MAMNTPFAIDFHIHTSHSFDSLTPPGVVVEIAKRRGLNGIAVTDHDTIGGALAAVSANKDPDFLVIPGIEVKSDLGDVIGLYLSRDIKSHAFGDVIEEIHEQGGIAYVPHPIRTFGAAHVPDVFAQYPSIELWERYNGRYGPREFAQADFVFTEVGIEAALCGSDAHFPWEIGLFRTQLPELPRDPQTLLAAVNEAQLHAEVRDEMALRSGITLGTVTKTFKRKQYAKLGLLVASLPWKALKRSISVGQHPDDS